MSFKGDHAGPFPAGPSTLAKHFFPTKAASGLEYLMLHGINGDKAECIQISKGCKTVL